MKAIFITLLGVNLVVFGWFQYQVSKTPATPNVVVFEEGVALGNLVMPSPTTVPAVPAVPAVPVVAAKPAVCLELGSLATETEVSQLQARLLALDIKTTVRIEIEQVVKDYWVYIAPYPSFQDAKQQLAELNQKGVDSFIFTEGDLKNGLSLGVYSKRDNASSIFKKVESLGYQPRIRESFQDVSRYFVVLDADGASIINPAILDPIKTRYPQIEAQKIDC